MPAPLVDHQHDDRAARSATPVTRRARMCGDEYVVAIDEDVVRDRCRPALLDESVAAAFVAGEIVSALAASAAIVARPSAASESLCGNEQHNDASECDSLANESRWVHPNQISVA